MADDRIRVLIAKPGLDGHETGAKLIARVLRDAGMEVIYTGPRQSPEMIAEAAAQEDVGVVGLSMLSGSHRQLCPRVMSQLRQRGLNNVVVLLGGVIPQEDIPYLKEVGIVEVFGPGTDTRSVVDYIRKNVSPLS